MKTNQIQKEKIIFSSNDLVIKFKTVEEKQRVSLIDEVIKDKDLKFMHFNWYSNRHNIIKYLYKQYLCVNDMVIWESESTNRKECVLDEDKLVIKYENIIIFAFS